MVDSIILGFSACFSLLRIFYCFLGVTLGMIVGVLPELGPFPQ